MFDLGQIVEKVSGLFEQGGATHDVLQGGVVEFIQNANIDVDTLGNLPLDQISELLTQAGVDPANLSDGDMLTVAKDLVQSAVAEK